jgi:hypothetical protein
MAADSTDSTSVSDSTAAGNPFKTGVYKGYDMFAIATPILFVGGFVIMIIGGLIVTVLPYYNIVSDIITGVTIFLASFTVLGSFASGIIGLGRIKKSNKKLKGKGLAASPFIAIIATLGLIILGGILSLLFY